MQIVPSCSEWWQWRHQNDTKPYQCDTSTLLPFPKDILCSKPGQLVGTGAWLDLCLSPAFLQPFFFFSSSPLEAVILLQGCPCNMAAAAGQFGNILICKEHPFRSKNGPVSLCGLAASHRSTRKNKTHLFPLSFHTRELKTFDLQVRYSLHRSSPE